MSERWRCFVAIRIDHAIGASLATCVARWRHEPPADALRWVDPGGWHLTVAFIGSVDPERARAIARVVAEIASEHRPAEVRTGRLGAFPRPGSVRTLWYGVSDSGGAITAIAGACATRLELQPDEPFRPHVTLARARRRAVDLRGWIDQASESAPEGRLPVDSLHLIRSHLGAGPARYETLGSWPIGGHAA